MREKKYLIKNYKQMFTVIAVFTLMLLVGGVTYAFFNYTRTGEANTVRTGTINFTSSQSGTFNLTNVFPIATGDVLNDNSNSSEVVITVSGDTTYSQGIEYLVTLEDVNIRTNTNRKVPVGLMVTPEKTGELGTSDNAYFTNRGGSTSIYKSFVGQSDIIEEGQYVLVGYIRPGAAEVNGTIGIRAFIDRDSIAITDTPEENVEWQNGRMVLSTSEWNSLNNQGISFKVRVVANEGVWVGEPTSRNDLKNFSSTLTSAQKSSITEINFIRMSEEMINTHADLIDLTEENGQGVVKGWIENNKLYIASPGVTYLPENCSQMFANYINLTNIEFNNANANNVIGMQGMFSNCSGLTSLNLSNLNTNNLQYMADVFHNCSSLNNIVLGNFDTSKVIIMSALFEGCTSLTNLDFLSNFSTDSATNMTQMFKGCTGLTSIDLSAFDTRNVTNMAGMFYGCTNLLSVNISGLGSNNLTVISEIFDGCSNLTEVNMSNFNLGKVSYLGGLFWGLNSLKLVDFSGLISGNVTTDGLFHNCSSLTTIYVSNTWNVNNITSSSGMFTGCSTALTGGNGTHWDSSNPTDATYAVIDTPSTPGYLTLKQN